MTRSSFLRFLSIVFGAFVVASCSDSGVLGPEVLPDAPTLTDAPRAVSGLELRALWWKDRDKTLLPVSQTIGVLGGTITIPQTGLTVSFPAGAVAAPITITITPDQDYVAYKMEPAGTQFLAPVTVTQSILYTELDGRQLTKPLFAAYIADDKVSLSGNVPVSELEPAQTIFSPLSPLIPQSYVWIIRHFSRYMLASG
jgi:hypothetical protein